ncbi:MAG: hypothetical protein LCH52_09755 [Bacteroidetes bacterium]|nr:hypothetical protein [Bacteroidota bacterium]
MKKIIIIVFVFIVSFLTLFTFVNNSSDDKKTVVLAGKINSDTSLIDSASQNSIDFTPSDSIGKNQIVIIYPSGKENLKGRNVLITMGGMGAKLKWVQKWTEELYKAKLNEFNIGMIIVVKGPVEEYYDSREIEIKKMTKRYVAAYQEYGFNETYLIVHSSGVFPAHQMFDFLYIGGDDPNNKSMKMRKLEVLDPEGITKNRITYIMLDGELGIPKGYTLTEKMVKNLKKIYSFYAVDAETKTFSGMAKEAKMVKNKFQDETILYEYIAENSGCNRDAKWCVHETLITTRPHNPAGYDLEKDYQFFDSTRKVVTGYMGVVKNGKWE